MRRFKGAVWFGFFLVAVFVGGFFAAASRSEGESLIPVGPPPPARADAPPEPGTRWRFELSGTIELEGGAPAVTFSGKLRADAPGPAAGRARHAHQDGRYRPFGAYRELAGSLPATWGRR